MLRLVIIFIFFYTSFSQSSNKFNPNISIVGDLRFFHEKDLPGKDGDFSFRGLELVIDNYLNPYVSANTTIHFSDEEKVDIEEAYITILKGLPLNSQIRFGRYFLPFGEILQKHSHVYSFMDYPKMHQSFFGEEGTRNLGFELNFGFPVLDQFSEFKIGVLEGNISASEHHEEEEIEEHNHESSAQALAYHSYFSMFHELSDYSNLKHSFSYIYGANDASYEEKIKLLAYAAKFKWKKDDDTSFELLAEIFNSSRNHHEEEHGEEEEEVLKATAYFLSINYQFMKHYTVGLGYSGGDHPIEEAEEIKSFSAFMGYAPFEESIIFRLKFNRDLELKKNKIELQAVFALGPHKPHQF
jgi:hypothetical protein